MGLAAGDLHGDRAALAAGCRVEAGDFRRSGDHLEERGAGDGRRGGPGGVDCDCAIAERGRRRNRNVGGERSGAVVGDGVDRNVIADRDGAGRGEGGIDAGDGQVRRCALHQVGRIDVGQLCLCLGDVKGSRFSGNFAARCGGHVHRSRVHGDVDGDAGGNGRGRVDDVAVDQDAWERKRRDTLQPVGVNAVDGDRGKLYALTAGIRRNAVDDRGAGTNVDGIRDAEHLSAGGDSEVAIADFGGGQDVAIHGHRRGSGDVDVGQDDAVAIADHRRSRRRPGSGLAEDGEDGAALLLDGTGSGREQKRRAGSNHKRLREIGDFAAGAGACAGGTLSRQRWNGESERGIGVVVDDRAGHHDAVAEAEHGRAVPVRVRALHVDGNGGALRRGVGRNGRDQSQARSDGEACAADYLGDRGRVGRIRDDAVAAGRGLQADADALRGDGGTENGRRTVDGDAGTGPSKAERSGVIEGRELAEDVDGDVLRALHA